VLQGSVKRPRLTAADRFLWAWLCSVWDSVGVVAILWYRPRSDKKEGFSP